MGRLALGEEATPKVDRGEGSFCTVGGWVAWMVTWNEVNDGTANMGAGLWRAAGCGLGSPPDNEDWRFLRWLVDRDHFSNVNEQIRF